MGKIQIESILSEARDVDRRVGPIERAQHEGQAGWPDEVDHSGYLFRPKT